MLAMWIQQLQKQTKEITIICFKCHIYFYSFIIFFDIKHVLTKESRGTLGSLGKLKNRLLIKKACLKFFTFGVVAEIQMIEF